MARSKRLIKGVPLRLDDSDVLFQQERVAIKYTLINASLPCLFAACLLQLATTIDSEWAMALGLIFTLQAALEWCPFLRGGIYRMMQIFAVENDLAIRTMQYLSGDAFRIQDLLAFTNFRYPLPNALSMRM